MKTLIAIVALAIAAAANAQSYYTGSVGAPDIFGNRQVHYSNGVTGTLSGPDIFGNQTMRYNNGATVQYGAPDIFGNRQIQVQTMPRNYGW